MAGHDNMELAVVHVASNVLTMPEEEFIENYMHPVEDDSWIRHEEIVKMENLVETEGGEKIKKEILQDYIEDHVRRGSHKPDPVLEGMMWQERFLEDYRAAAHSQDASRAAAYRRQLVSNFRRKQTGDSSVNTTQHEDGGAASEARSTVQTEVDLMAVKEIETEAAPQPAAVERADSAPSADVEEAASPMSNPPIEQPESKEEEEEEGRQTTHESMEEHDVVTQDENAPAAAIVNNGAEEKPHDEDREHATGEEPLYPTEQPATEVITETMEKEEEL